MSDAPFVPGNFAGPGLTGEHLAAVGMAQREARMDKWACELACAVVVSASDEDSFDEIAARTWRLVAALEREREKTLIAFAKEMP